MTRVLLIVAWCACSAACGGRFVTRTTEIVAPSARVPISLTHALVDVRGIVAPDRIERVTTFTHDHDACDQGGTTLVDISDPVNAQVAAADGDAVVGLVVGARKHGDCALVRVTGEIVRVRPSP